MNPDILTKLRDAEKLACPAPWKLSSSADGDFISLMRNSLPDLLAYVAKLERVVDAADALFVGKHIGNFSDIDESELYKALKELRG